MNKLLDKTSQAYILYASIILMVAAPLFYYATKEIYLKEADDTLRLHKKEFLKYTQPSLTKADVIKWNRFNRNIKLSASGVNSHDSLFFASYYDTLDAEIEPYRVLNFPFSINNEKYTHSERINLVETSDLLENIAVLFVAIICILLIGLFVITKKLSRKLWKPFYATLDEIERFELDKTGMPNLQKTNIEEFHRLNKSVEKLIERNILIYKNQREFVENAAHELQTPLAVFQAKIDTLIQRSDITEEQSIILSSLNENIFRLNHLNKNLLLLSKIDYGSYNDRQTILVNNFIKKNLSFFTEQASAKKINAQIDLHQELQIEGNSTLLEIMTNNLFLNAIRHNIPNGKIIITLQENKLVFANTGQTQPLNNEKLFSRFSKENPSEQGSGLGLSIVKKIVDINKWRIDYVYENNLHTFSILF